MLRDSTTIANAFVRQYASGRPGRASIRHVSQDIYQLALDTIQQLAHALLDNQESVDMPPSRGARAALRGKHMANSLDWMGHLERVVTNHLYADADLDLDQAKSGVVRLGLLFDSLYRQELDAYRLMEEQLSGWHSRVGTGLLTYLLSGAPIAPSALSEQARMLSIDPNQPFRAVAFCHRVRQEIEDERWLGLRGRILDTLWRHDERRELLLLDRRGLLLALVPEDRPGPGLVTTLEKLLRDRDLAGEIYIACAEPDETLVSSGAGLRRAVAALEICVHRNLLGKVTREAEVMLDILLAQNEDVARSLVATSVSCLAEKQTLLDTLRAYINADLALQRTAEMLSVHPNTVVYRLRQIAELTGRDMRSIRSLIAFSNGLVALDVLTLNGAADHTEQDLRTALLSGE